MTVFWTGFAAGWLTTAAVLAVLVGRIVRARNRQTPIPKSHQQIQQIKEKDS